MELCMSRKERDRMKVIEQVERGLMSQVKAAEVLSLSVRQVRRIQGWYRRDGDRGLVHLTSSPGAAALPRGAGANGHIDPRLVRGTR